MNGHAERAPSRSTSFKLRRQRTNGLPPAYFGDSDMDSDVLRLTKDLEKKHQWGEERGIEAQIRNLKQTLEKEEQEGVNDKLQVKMGFSVKALPTVHTMGRRASRARLVVHDILSRQRFDACIGMVIVANSITIGVEQTYRMQGNEEVLQQCKFLEMIYIIVYTVELLMRFFAHGRACLSSAWVRFDFVLVTLGLFTTLVVEPMIERSSDTDGEPSDAAKLLGPVMVLRVLRLARLARAVRLLAQFKELWMLVRGLMSSAGTMFYTFLLIIIILYVFACLAIELITTDQEYVLTNILRFPKRCKGVHCVDLGESFPTHILLQNLASIQLRASPVKFACSPRTDPPGY